MMKMLPSSVEGCRFNPYQGVRIPHALRPKKKKKKKQPQKPYYNKFNKRLKNVFK